MTAHAESLPEKTTQQSEWLLDIISNVGARNIHAHDITTPLQSRRAATVQLNSNQLRFNELKKSGEIPGSIFSDNEQELARVVDQKSRACHLTGAKLAGKSSSDILSQIAL